MPMFLLYTTHNFELNTKVLLLRKIRLRRKSQKKLQKTKYFSQIFFFSKCFQVQDIRDIISPINIS